MQKTINLPSILEKYQTHFSKILSADLYAQGFCHIDLSANNVALNLLDLQDVKTCETYIHSLCQDKIGIGGYAEKRAWYAQSPVFRNEITARNIHLGVDIWAKAYTNVYNFMAGKIHSFAYNEGFGNYGGTIIMEYELENNATKIIFYVLYGHLSKQSLVNLFEGKTFEKGEKIAELGEPHENGGWAAHLHFQIIGDMQGNKGDFIGVAYENEQQHYLELCPNPNLILQLL
jgi:murein DD-endopeptidase MepM/ murein hydrolase activator NlpD